MTVYIICKVKLLYFTTDSHMKSSHSSIQTHVILLAETSVPFLPAADISVQLTFI